VIGKTYLVRQAATLLQFAKSTNDPLTAAALLEKAAELKEASATRPDQSLAAPDVEACASDGRAARASARSPYAVRSGGEMPTGIRS
jgi:hypothetical protein